MDAKVFLILKFFQIGSKGGKVSGSLSLGKCLYFALPHKVHVMGIQVIINQLLVFKLDLKQTVE